MISHVNVLRNPKRNEKSSCPIRRQGKNLEPRPTAEKVLTYKSFGLVEKWREDLFHSCFIIIIFLSKMTSHAKPKLFNTQLTKRKRLFSPKELPRTFQLISNTNWVGWSPDENRILLTSSLITPSALIRFLHFLILFGIKYKWEIINQIKQYKTLSGMKLTK